MELQSTSQFKELSTEKERERGKMKNRFLLHFDIIIIIFLSSPGDRFAFWAGDMGNESLPCKSIAGISPISFMGHLTLSMVPPLGLWRMARKLPRNAYAECTQIENSCVYDALMQIWETTVNHWACQKGLSLDKWDREEKRRKIRSYVLCALANLDGPFDASNFARS